MTNDRPAGTDEDRIEAIIAQFRAGFGELRCLGSERLIRRGVSMGHLHLMSIIDRHGGMPMSRLAELLDVSLSNATGLVDRMEERGWVTRSRVPDDRRVVMVGISDAGREALAEIDLIRGEVIRLILDRLGPEQLDRVAGAVEDIRSAVLEVIASEPELFSHRHPHADVASTPYPIADEHARTVTHTKGAT